MDSKLNLLHLLILYSLLSLTLADPSRRKSRFRKYQISQVANETEETILGDDDDELPSKRKGRLFSLFNIVTFKNDPCTATSTTSNGLNRNGTCMTVNECSDRSGMSMGNCAAGFGVCCLFIVQAGNQQVTQNCTYVQNQNFPQPLPDDPAGVMVNVQRCNNDVCFLRLDFEVFSILGTGGSNNANEGVCLDTFTVTTPTAALTPVICGLNTGYHMYVDIGAAAGDTATLAFAFNAQNVNRMFDIKVTQVECDNPSAPPELCLQYMFGLTGRIETFNFNNMADNHLNNQMYSICVRQEAGFCCVQYMVCTEQMALLNNGAQVTDATSGFSFDTTLGGVSATDDNCRSLTNAQDYISIPESAGMCNVNAAMSRAINSRYCGQFLNAVDALKANAPICDCTAPFTVDIFFNNVSDNPAAAINLSQSKGLCLEYMQVPC